MYEDCEDRQYMRNNILPPLNVRSMNNSFNQDIKAVVSGLEERYEPLKALKEWGQKPIPADQDPNRNAKINSKKLKTKTFSEQKELQNLKDGLGRSNVFGEDFYHQTKIAIGELKGMPNSVRNKAKLDNIFKQRKATM